MNIDPHELKAHAAQFYHAQKVRNEAQLALDPELVAVARAAEDYSSFSRRLPYLPDADDYRYTALIGVWDAYQTPEVRFQLWNERRKAQRRDVLAKAEAIERGGCDGYD